MNNSLPLLAILFVTAYAAGSINFSILAFRFSGREDPRRHGSGNAGATNVYRQAGIGWAAAVLLLDMARAMGMALLAVSLLPPDPVPWVGLGLVLGNRFPCFHRFKGGKGVANYLGFSVIVAPVWAGIGALAWGGAFLVWRTPFLSSFSLVACLAVGTIADPAIHGPGMAGTIVTVGLIVACHHQNIRQRWGHQP
ncbi:glycerol-3-phosphate acyltransferase [Desulfosarcina ovata]|uniref:Glycerol-3-phosphate acyltransferase n=1 Tax=Desulfosarcina ovata subsp. ovata TaxID=2752305 RepID=A0A5K8AIV2_9BACT|nr:glycerol-3-phosphate acyltransferase [Desulfosarcina ovata]BBO92426.1 glycerol-3-phosphate acyltransferase [Desulfosarcina ovata subsp. ovata]